MHLSVRRKFGPRVLIALHICSDSIIFYFYRIILLLFDPLIHELKPQPVKTQLYSSACIKAEIERDIFLTIKFLREFGEYAPIFRLKT